jgi:hypothetical protein
MSSSAEAPEADEPEFEPSWSAFTERPAGPDPVELLSPAQELAAALQESQKTLRATRDEGAAAVEKVLTIVAEQAALVFRLGVVLAESEDKLREAGLGRIRTQLSIVRRQMAEALDGAGLDVVDPVGTSFDEAQAHVEVVDWRHAAEFTDEVVAETIEPIVSYDGVVVRDGRVIMGAPLNGEERA